MAFPCEMKSAHSWAVRSSNPILRTFNVLEGRLASFCRPNRAANLLDSAFRASSPCRNFGIRYLVEANYRERCREGKTTPTAFGEPAVNQVVSKPFMKKAADALDGSRGPPAAANPGPSVERRLARHVVPVVPQHAVNARAEGRVAPGFFHSRLKPRPSTQRSPGIRPLAAGPNPLAELEQGLQALFRHGYPGFPFPVRREATPTRARSLFPLSTMSWIHFLVRRRK